MSAFVIPLEVVLHLLGPDHGTPLAQLGDRGTEVRCESTRERDVTCFTLSAVTPSGTVQTGTHPWISAPLVEELLTLLDHPRPATATAS